MPFSFLCRLGLGLGKALEHFKIIIFLPWLTEVGSSFLCFSSGQLGGVPGAKTMVMWGLLSAVGLAGLALSLWSAPHQHQSVQATF